ncbi:hypothetical protein SOVF_116160 [Spinacia oleracea]|nr:hypothetical protein SOVF_116160 [Spinacia oleracea]
MGPRPVPTKTVDENLEKDLMNKYRTVHKKGGGITKKTLMEYVEGPSEDDNEFKRHFLMLALDSVLTPTTCHRLSMKFFHCVAVAYEASEYDWCSLVLEQLLHVVGSFSKRFYADGYARVCGGCLIFMAIFYLDRLKRPPVDWGVFPRMRVWTIEEMNKAQNLDRLPSRDYGCVGCVDVPYGHTCTGSPTGKPVGHPLNSYDECTVTKGTPNLQSVPWVYRTQSALL